jgi:hypothetical protein
MEPLGSLKFSSQKLESSELFADQNEQNETLEGKTDTTGSGKLRESETLGSLKLSRVPNSMEFETLWR